MGWSDDELVPISALEHFAYCPRQCALIYVEQSFEDNIFTLRGRAHHIRVDSGCIDEDDGIRRLRALPIFSRSYGLTGRADLVELMQNGTPYPVEYKSGRAKTAYPERVQLAAQALCLEEMFGTKVSQGALYFVASKRRVPVEITDQLRSETLDVIRSVREQLVGTLLPPPVNDSRCVDCSLIELCQPKLLVNPEFLRNASAKLYEAE